MNAQEFVDTCSKVLFKKENKGFVLHKCITAHKNIPAFKLVSYRVYVKSGKKVELAFTYEKTIKIIAPKDREAMEYEFIESFLEVLLSKSKIYEAVKV